MLPTLVLDSTAESKLVPELEPGHTGLAQDYITVDNINKKDQININSDNSDSECMDNEVDSDAECPPCYLRDINTKITSLQESSDNMFSDLIDKIKQLQETFSDNG